MKGNKLKESRIHQEIRTKLFQTCREFALKNKISRTTVSGWGNGKKISPGHCKLLHTLGISQEAIERPGERV
jgi:DNA-binding transcriptional regulator YiaG